jgi:predicted enzyme related to lactoylglutathione lyase
MSFKVQKFTTIRISSANVEVSRDWYAKLFGIDPFVDIKNFASFNIAGTIFDIALADAKSPLSPGGSVGYWLTDDMNELLKKVEDLGAKVYRGPLKVPEIQKTILQIQDPYGNVIGFEVPF